MFYHDVPPELIRRIALRHTDGHVKYGVKHMNLNWRIGINDIEYVVDRFNHLFEHLLDFLENGNEKDDNLGAIAWSAGFLMEVERLAPQVFRQLMGQCKLFGESARLMKEKLEEEESETK